MPSNKHTERKKEEEVYATVAYDIQLMKPGCALLQATLGGFTRDGRNVSEFFDNKVWLLAPSNNMKLYPLKTKEELMKLVLMTNRKHKI